MKWHFPLIRTVTTHIPGISGVGFGRLATKIANKIAPKSSTILTARVLGSKMSLDVADSLERCWYFYPQFYDTEEIGFLSRALRPGDFFVDLGSHIGFYSLWASRIVGSQGKVLAIEADPENYRRLVSNVKLNCLENVVARNVAACDKPGTVEMHLEAAANRGANSIAFKGDSKRSIRVEGRTLLDIVRDSGLARIDAMKMDIEGLETPVMETFFASAPRELWPRSIITETLDAAVDGRSSIESLLKRRGYGEFRRTSTLNISCRLHTSTESA